MWEANPTWGSPNLVAELAMRGIDVAKSTVEKYPMSGILSDLCRRIWITTIRGEHTSP
jgi:hypothetical protein